MRRAEVGDAARLAVESGGGGGGGLTGDLTAEAHRRLLRGSREGHCSCGDAEEERKFEDADELLRKEALLLG